MTVEMGYGDVKWFFLHLSAITGEDMSLTNSKLEMADLLMGGVMASPF
jgi:hypothetical protein